MIQMLRTQKIAKVIALGMLKPRIDAPPPTDAKPGHSATRKVWIASPPIEHWMPNQAARDDRPQHGGNVRAARPERRAREHGEGDAIARSRVRVEQDRHQARSGCRGRWSAAPATS